MAVDNLQIGTCGWQTPEGQGHFYPEDMPIEWQLDYYSNAFRVVLVPEAQWLAWTSADFEDCVDGVEGTFEFYLRVEHELTSEKEIQINRVQKGLGALLKGVIVFSESHLPTKRIALLPVSLVSKSLVMPGWSYALCGYQVSGNPVGYCDTLSNEGKEQAGLLKSFMQTLPDNSLAVAFFIGGDSINMSQVSNLKVVGEFLGY